MKARILFSVVVVAPGALIALLLRLGAPASEAQLDGFEFRDALELLATMVLAPFLAARFAGRILAEARDIHLTPFLVAYWIGVIMGIVAGLAALRFAFDGRAPGEHPLFFVAAWIAGPFIAVLFATHVRNTRFG